MNKAFELAWQLIDNLCQQYASKEEAVAELGELDDLALRYSQIIEDNDLSEETDLLWLQCQIDEIF